MGQQQAALLINFITYYVFVVPFSYVFSFMTGPEMFNRFLARKELIPVDYTKGETFGVHGLYLGFVIGLGH